MTKASLYSRSPRRPAPGTGAAGTAPTVPGPAPVAPGGGGGATPRRRGWLQARHAAPLWALAGAMAAVLAMWAEETKPLETFQFRATSPLYLGDVAGLCRAGNRYWIEGPGRPLCMTASSG